MNMVLINMDGAPLRIEVNLMYGDVDEHRQKSCGLGKFLGD